MNDPGNFLSARDHQMKRHGDSSCRVHQAVTAEGYATDYHAIVGWRNGEKIPRTPESLRIVGIIAERYRLPAEYFIDRMGRWRALSALAIKGIAVVESRHLAGTCWTTAGSAAAPSRRKSSNG